MQSGIILKKINNIDKIITVNHDVFISFAFKDQEVANCIRSYLERNGIKCFMCLDLPAGTGYDEALGKAIREANVLMLVLSPDADNSRSVRNETAIAKNRGKTIIPVRIVDFLPEKLEYLIATSLFFDAFPQPLENHLPKLADDISRILNIPLPPPPPPPHPVDPPWPCIVKDQQWHPIKYEYLMDWVKEKLNILNAEKILLGSHFDYRRNKYTGGYEIKLKQKHTSYGYNPMLYKHK